MAREAEWTETASADDALATVTRTAEAGPRAKRHIISYVFASFSATGTSALLQIKEAGVVIAEHYVHDAEVLAMDHRAASGVAVSVELGASGTPGTVGKVNMVGRSE